MCIVIDMNVIPSLFSSSAEDHDEFKPILTWITHDSGKIIYGGKKYKQELSKLKKFLRFFSHLKRAGKVIEINDEQVDQYQEELEKKITHRDFDDAHIVAILVVSRCRLVATKEKRAIPFFKNIELYPSKIKKPKIYTGNRNTDLLSKENIANICLPASKQLVEFTI